MGNYRDLEVWKLGREVVKLAYQVSTSLPETERFGLVSQIQRAAVSIPVNVSEGAGRKSDGSFAHFVRIACGSVNELETLLILAEDLGFLTAAETVEINGKLRNLGIKLQNLAAAIRPGEVHESAVVYGDLTTGPETTGRPTDDN